jgi:hypothetical protein
MVTPSSLRDVMVAQQSKKSSISLASRLKTNLLLKTNSSNYSVNEKQVQSPWYKKLWKFLKPVKKQKKDETVWYGQFPSNPPPPAGMKQL